MESSLRKFQSLSRVLREAIPAKIALDLCEVQPLLSKMIPHEHVRGVMVSANIGAIFTLRYRTPLQHRIEIGVRSGSNRHIDRRPIVR